MNGVNGISHRPYLTAAANGRPVNGLHEPTQEELERELPHVAQDQVPLREVLSRVVQAIYTELCELAETLPNMSDPARKRTIADWVVKTKKQVVKLYVVAKWSRDADTVQKAMNITAFLESQNTQFNQAADQLQRIRDALDNAKRRNHDLLTSLDVLAHGSYLRLPAVFRKHTVPLPPLKDQDIDKIVKEMNDAVRYRLRMKEIIPMEMANYTISDGLAHFVAPKLFKASCSLNGAHATSGWFLVDVEFLITVIGDSTIIQEFPRAPKGPMKVHITEEGNVRLGIYVPIPKSDLPPDVPVPPRPKLPTGTVDAPLVRLFNFLQMMSLSYQLEILWFQAQRMRSLGWAEYMTADMSRDRKTLTVKYWIRNTGPPKPPNPNRPKPPPPLGGTLTIAIVEANAPAKIGGGPIRPPKSRVLAELQQRSKLGGLRPTDGAEGYRIQVKWAPEQNVLGVNLAPHEATMSEKELFVDPDALDFEPILLKVLRKHTAGILRNFEGQLKSRSVLAAPGEVTLVHGDREQHLRVHLCADEYVTILIDQKSGRVNMLDVGDLASAGRGSRFLVVADRINHDPHFMWHVVEGLRIRTITDIAEQKANYLDLQSFRFRNFPPEEMQKLGPTRPLLYIAFSRFPGHYLVICMTPEDFRYALISTEVVRKDKYPYMIMKDVGWVNINRIHGDPVAVPAVEQPDPPSGQKRKRPSSDDGEAERAGEPAVLRYNPDLRVFRELYSYCCARIAYSKIEQQFKNRGIPYQHVKPDSDISVAPVLASVQSPLARSVPALCVQSFDILSGVPAADAAMPNIRVLPLNWWSEKSTQVVTCVKLKYVQQPMGKRAGSSRVIRPSKRIIYDTAEAVVAFLSDNVDNCVDEFLEEWARVSKMVVIAREVAQMAKERQWPDVRLLSFDLQTVEFAYGADYTVSITCTDQLSPTGGSYDLRFSRAASAEDKYNPHEEAEPYMRNIMRHGSLTHSLHKLVGLLRDTLPVVAELEDIRAAAIRDGKSVDTFPKAAGWYRLLYGDLRHALDFRLMKGPKVLILDASHSFFGLSRTGQPSASRPSNTNSDHLGRGTGDGSLVLQPIPNFHQAIVDTIKTLGPLGARGKVAAVDVGVICDISVLRTVSRALHERVSGLLAG